MPRRMAIPRTKRKLFVHPDSPIFRLKTPSPQKVEWHLRIFLGQIVFFCFGSLAISMNFTLMKQIVGAWHDSKTANLNTHTHIHCCASSLYFWDRKSWGWHRAKIISTSVCNFQHFLLDPLEETENYSHCPYAGDALTFFIISLSSFCKMNQIHGRHIQCKEAGNGV